MPRDLGDHYFSEGLWVSPREDWLGDSKPSGKPKWAGAHMEGTEREEEGESALLPSSGTGVFSAALPLNLKLQNIYTLDSGICSPRSSGFFSFWLQAASLPILPYSKTSDFPNWAAVTLQALQFADSHCGKFQSPWLMVWALFYHYIC